MAGLEENLQAPIMLTPTAPRQLHNQLANWQRKHHLQVLFYLC
jgi:hypothetical protein